VKLTKGAGCATCRGTGFRGRVGLFELLTLDEPLREAIVRNAPRSELRRLSEDVGMRPMQQDGWQKIEAGLTTVEEVLRVVQS
jgi:type II secretory ATPase GspE/PulE/Tfp pilus assembly ATPase PilB-like protein